MSSNVVSSLAAISRILSSSVPAPYRREAGTPASTSRAASLSTTSPGRFGQPHGKFVEERLGQHLNSVNIRQPVCQLGRPGMI